MIPTIVGLVLVAVSFMAILVIIVCMAKGIFEKDYYKDLDNNEKCEV